MATMTATAGRTGGLAYNEKFVIFASSLGTIFEWYDFYLYAVLTPFVALIFGRLGDIVGRKYTFLVTIMVMGASTFAVGLLPTFATVELPGVGTVGGIGWAAPVLLVTLRLLQGLALGGEYGGAATYV